MKRARWPWPRTNSFTTGQKRCGQLEVLRAVDRGLDAVIINPTAVLGPYDYKPSRMGDVLLDLYHNRYPALVDGGYNWVDARDVVACALAAEKIGKEGRGVPGKRELVPCMRRGAHHSKAV